MDAKQIKSMLDSAILSVTDNIDDYVVHPGRDFSRNSKFSCQKLISFLISEGSSSIKNEIIDFFNLHDPPTEAALIQQRNKLSAEAVRQVMYAFNENVSACSAHAKYRFIATDGSTATFYSNPRFTPGEYLVDKGHSAKGSYSVHINAFQDIHSNIYTDVLMQPVHEKDEFGAFAKIVDRHPVLPETKNVYIGDRGYCSYNNMAHVVKAGQYFMFRAKDVTSKGMTGGFGIRADECCDVEKTVRLTRTLNKKVFNTPECRFICSKVAFDYIERGSMDFFDMSFRIVRFKISASDYECVVTNLPPDEFPLESIKSLYNERWNIESSFRKLKYTIGLSNFHSVKPEFIKQEILARIVLYNATEFMVSNTVVNTEGKDRKYCYKVNFTVAAHVCRIFFRCTTNGDSVKVMELISREVIPIRNNRQFPRLQTAHFRRPRYFIYRAA